MSNIHGEIQKNLLNYIWSMDKIIAEDTNISYDSPLFTTNINGKLSQYQLNLNYFRAIDHHKYFKIYLNQLSIPTFILDVTFELTIKMNQEEKAIRSQVISPVMQKTCCRFSWTIPECHLHFGKPLVAFKLSINCCLRFHDVNLISADQPFVSNYLKGFDQIEQFFDNEILSDIKIVVGTSTFRAHRLILSLRSPVFAAMFYHDMKEKRNNCVEINDIEANVMKEVLRFIYTGKVKNIDKHANEFVSAAEKYQLEDLKTLSETSLINNLNSKNLLAILKLTDCYKLNRLKQQALQFIRGHGDVIANDEFQKYLKSLPSSLLIDAINTIAL